MYRGQVEINNTLHQFRFEDFKLVISGHERFISWSQINKLVDNEIIILKDIDNNVLYLKIDDRFYNSSFEYGFNISAYVIKYNRNQSDSADSSLSFDNMIFRSDVIDYFFRNNEIFRQETVRLFMNDNESGENPKPTRRPSVNMMLDNKPYKLDFGTMMQVSDLPFPYVIKNYIKIHGEKMNGLQDAFRIAKTIQLFLKFISQSPNVNFYDSIWLVKGEDVNDRNTFMFFRPEHERLNANRILLYEDIDEIVGSLIEMIYNDQICFRSLFVSDYDRITHADIMNICAAFETQFRQRYIKNFRYKEQELVKKKMIEVLEQARDLQFDEKEKPLFDELLNGIKYVSETLRKRIEIALSDFIKMYGEDEIKFDFEESYAEMPERIKNSRNALDHGRIDYPFQNVMYWDAELLRAVVYMMILETAGLVDDKNKIKKSIRKLSKRI